MKILFRLSILFIPISLIIFLFVYLKEDKFYPGADFRAGGKRADEAFKIG